MLPSPRPQRSARLRRVRMCNKHVLFYFYYPCGSLFNYLLFSPTFSILKYSAIRVISMLLFYFTTSVVLRCLFNYLLLSSPLVYQSKHLLLLQIVLVLFALVYIIILIHLLLFYQFLFHRISFIIESPV